MGTTLALCGTVAGWGVITLMTRRRVAAIRARCGEAEAENARWRLAYSGREPEDAGSRAAPGGRRPEADGPDFTERAFANIGRRVQAIVHRQLGDLGEMQQRHGGDPAVFADLMRLDHGTALIGRLADSLVVLAGERPGRHQGEPVPVFSVLRGAMSRIVDYRRVELAAAPEVELAGPAVEAVVHALAELLDNATRYSPPDSRVVLAARRTAGGVEIDVVDAGVGLAPKAAEHVARVLTEPGRPGLDLADVGGTPRLGLAVIGRLAHTVGFQVSVRPSTAGGVTAQLVVPEDLVMEPAGVAFAPAAPRDVDMFSRPPRAEARSAGGPGPRPEDTRDARPADLPSGLPQRRRRAQPATGAVRTSSEAGAADGASGPGQWLEAFGGGPPESADGDGDGEHGDDGRRGMAW